MNDETKSIDETALEEERPEFIVGTVARKTFKERVCIAPFLLSKSR